eukprot:5658176-Amphidinium_carterae.1
MSSASWRSSDRERSRQSLNPGWSGGDVPGGSASGRLPPPSRGEPCRTSHDSFFARLSLTGVFSQNMCSVKPRGNSNHGL